VRLTTQAAQPGAAWGGRGRVRSGCAGPRAGRQASGRPDVGVAV